MKYSPEKERRDALFDGPSKYDVFNTYLLHDAEYAGELEMPVLKGVQATPNKLVPFSKAMVKSFTERDCWICFYEHDINFLRLWRHPEKYLAKMLEFNGIISPDFSMYRNMPAIMQYWSCFMGRAIAHRYQADGGMVIPNVRLSDRRSHRFCLDGLPRNSTIAIGTHGCIKHAEDRHYTRIAVEEAVMRLNPVRIIVYGSAPDDVFVAAIERGVEVVEFKSLFSQTHEKRDGNGNG